MGMLGQNYGSSRPSGGFLPPKLYTRPERGAMWQRIVARIGMVGAFMIFLTIPGWFAWRAWRR